MYVAPLSPDTVQHAHLSAACAVMSQHLPACTNPECLTCLPYPQVHKLPIIEKLRGYVQAQLDVQRKLQRQGESTLASQNVS